MKYDIGTLLIIDHPSQGRPCVRLRAPLTPRMRHRRSLNNVLMHFVYIIRQLATAWDILISHRQEHVIGTLEVSLIR